MCGDSNKGLPSANGPGGICTEKRKADDTEINKDLKKVNSIINKLSNSLMINLKLKTI